MKQILRDEEVGEIKKHNAELLGEVDTLTAEVERLRAGFYQQVTDVDLKKIADYVSDPDLPKGAFLRQDAYDLANMCLHMVREVQASRVKLVVRDSLLRRAVIFTHDLLGPIRLRRDIEKALSTSAEPRKADQ